MLFNAKKIKNFIDFYTNICYNTCYVFGLGLLCTKKDLAANDIPYMVEEINDFKGGMAENYVNV